jgi:hypothetical protein
MIEVENPPPDPKERTASDPASLYGPADPAAVTAGAPVDLRPPPEPCLICGAPFGTCTDHVEPVVATVAPDAAPDVSPGTVSRARRVRVQGTEDANSDPDAKVYICPEDIVEVFESGPPGRSQRRSRRLVHRKGEIITRDRAIQLGLVEGTVSTPPVPPPPHRVVEGTPVTVPQL